MVLLKVPRRPLAGLLVMAALLVAAGQEPALGDDRPFVVNCYDESLGSVQRMLSGDCDGRVVSDEEAEAIREERRRRIRGVLSQPSESGLQGRRLAGIGSGFFVSAGGQVVTSNHVVEDCALVTVEPSAGERRIAELVGAEASSDLALLDSGAAAPGVAVLGAPRTATAREPVAFVGYPNQGLVPLRPVLTSAEVVGRQMAGADLSVLVVKGDVRSGNSGGPLLDGGGLVLGVVFAKINSVKVFAATGQAIRDVGFVVPVERLQAFLDRFEVDYRRDRARAPIGSSFLLDEARAYVVRVGCWK